jgi:putative glutamine amidotransferase
MKTNGLKPVIGITMSFDKSGLVRPDVDYNLIRREYGEQLKAAGASPIFLDNTIDPEVAAELCDGIVISGGEDIDPHFYKQDAKHVRTTEPNERTEWERELIDACDMRKVRILGICYGSQLLNVHYGGSLFQDIAMETGSKLNHGKSTASAMHNVTFKSNFLDFKANEIVESASRHHQAVNKLGKGFKVAAVAEDGIIEAIAGNGHYGVQWHAEADGTAAKIYGAFVALVKQPVLEDNEIYGAEPVLEPGLI